MVIRGRGPAPAWRVSHLLAALERSPGVAYQDRGANMPTNPHVLVGGVALHHHHPVAALPQRTHQRQPVPAQAADDDVADHTADPEHLDLLVKDRQQGPHCGGDGHRRGEEPRHLEFPGHRMGHAAPLQDEELKVAIQDVPGRWRFT